MSRSFFAAGLTRRSFLGRAALLGAIATGSRSASSSAQSGGFSWRLLDSEGGSAARWDHTLSGDPTTKQLMLFGGRDAGGASFGDTWLYDLVNHAWRQVEGSGPEPRFGQAVAFDESSGKLVLFGGQTSDTFFNDTWVFDFAGESWTKLDTGDRPLPTPRYGLPAVFDAHGNFIISHGFTFEGRFDDTWSLDLSSNQWTDVSPGQDGVRPLKRCLHEMAWDQAAGRLLLFGGCSSGFGPCPQGDLWSFDPASSAWTQLAPPEGPSSRSNPAMIYDERGTRAFLIGGLSDAGYMSDVWSGALDGDDFTWTAITPDGTGPSPRASHDLVLTRGDIYLFGGTGVDGVTNDLWKLSLD